jgi:hypothetical protein
MKTKHHPGLIPAIIGLFLYMLAYLFYAFIFMIFLFEFYGVNPRNNVVVQYFLPVDLSLGYLAGILAVGQSIYSIFREKKLNNPMPGLLGLIIGLVVFLSGSVFIYFKYYGDFYYDHLNTRDPPKPYLTSGLTLRSTRTPPALSSALSLRSASPASFIASVQAGPVSFIR